MEGSVTSLTNDDRGAQAIIGRRGGDWSGFHAASEALKVCRSWRAARTSVEYVGAESCRQRMSGGTTSGSAMIVVVESAASVSGETDGAVVVAGSHDGRTGGAAERAVKVRPLPVAHNDAGTGLHGAGTGRFPARGVPGMAAICDSVESARLGDEVSPHRVAFISVTNAPACTHGAHIGTTIIDLISSLAARPDDCQAPAAVRTPFN